jgi:formylglycine-generating enzyme required for sulfatase activity/energy-coupling factor transporter ATP-binding protein EcfA2
VLIAALACVAAWLALPQLQPLLDRWSQNPLFWPFAIVVVLFLLVLLVLVPFIDWGAILVLLRQLSPKHRFETRYIKAVSKHLNLTPALLVISERNELHTEMNLLQAYSQLTLAPDPDDPTPMEDPGGGERQGKEVMGLGIGRGGARPGEKHTPGQSLTYGLLWLATQAALLTCALLLVARLLWNGEQGLHLGWGTGLLALLVVLLWLGLAAVLHRFGLPRLRQHRQNRRTLNATLGSPGAEIWQHPRLLIQGHPGSGKTTLLRHIAVVCADELLKQRHRTRLRDAYGWPTCPFPIYIPLRVLRDISVSGTQSLLTSYADTLHEIGLLGPDMARSCTPDFFERKVARGGCIILLDAFDELRDPAARQRLGLLVSELPPGPPHNPNRIVVTSRIVGYEGQLRGKDFIHRYLDELDPEQTAAFIRTRYHALAQLSLRASGEHGGGYWNPDRRARSLIERLPTHPGLRRLGRNPFLLSLIVSVDLKSERLPRQRHTLYERALDLLVQEWEPLKDLHARLEPAAPDAELEQNQKPLDQAQKLRLLYELAWIMYEHSLAADADDNRSHTVIRGRDAETILARVLATIPTIAGRREGAALDEHCRTQAQKWLRNLGQRGGVLQELGNIRGSSEVEIQFAHQTFQEYLASQAVRNASAEEHPRRVHRLLDRWNDTRWNEVFLLYAATCADASPMVQHLLQQQQPAADMLAGSVLAEAGSVKDGAMQTKTLTRMTHLALADTTIAPAEALKALHTLDEIQGADGQHTLLDAIFRAHHRAVRIRSIELLARMEPNRPAPAPLDGTVQETLRRLLRDETDVGLRLAAGFALARCDPHDEGDGKGWLPDMVEIPAGPFRMGSTYEDEQALKWEKPQHTRDLPRYWISKTPVTNAQWRRFVAAGGYTNRRYWSRAGWHWRRCGWEPEGNIYTTFHLIAILALGPLFDRVVGVLRRRPPFEHPWATTWLDTTDWNGNNQPVVGVSFYEAEAYCRWLSEASGHPFVLPSEEEWEKAARGPNGRTWPWGNTWHAQHCNSAESGIGRTSPVGSYPAGASLYGVQDMAGNVWEWCRTRYKHNYPGRPVGGNDRLINLLAVWTRALAIRGGSWYNSQNDVRGAYRLFNLDPRYRFVFNGIRLASHSPLRPDAES